MISPRALLRTARRPPLPHFSWTPRVPTRTHAWRHLSLKQFLWLVLWAPWWVGNDMPPPNALATRQPVMSEPPAGGAGAWVLDQLDDLRFRFGLTWTLALALRGAWLGGLVGIGWIVVAQLSALSMPGFSGIVPLVIGGALFGLVLRVFHRPGYHHIAQMLDTTFSLRSRINTAVTGLRLDDARPEGLHRLQLADAANALGRARGLISREHWLPVREIFMACIVAVIMLFLLIAQQPEDDIAPVSTTGIPGFVPVSERLAEAQEQAVTPPEIPDAATVQEVEDISRESNQARQDLDEIGEALLGNSVTSPAGESIEAGDYPRANEQLSESSGDVAQLPEADRARLADDLDEAADQVSDANPELADSARNAADEARSGKDNGALDDLGDQIEETGSSVVSQDGSSAELSNSPSQSSSGQPSSGGSGQEASQQPPQGGQVESGPGAPRAGDPGAGMSASGGVGQSGEDGAPSEGAGNPGENGQRGGQPGDAPEGGSGEPSSNASGSSGGGEGETAGAANDASLSGNPNEEGVSSQGSGAGGGQRNANDPNQPSDSSGGGDPDNEQQAPEAGEGEAGDPPPGGADENGDASTTDVPDTNASIALPGTSDDRVRSGSDIGSSSVGSGGGVGAASGNSTGGTSGSAGPDSNDVPEAWRQVVEDYFREGGAP